MFFDCFIKGMSLAFYIVVPIGAISVYYIKRTLQNGIASGIVSSLGVTTAEGIYAAAAIYGISFISDFLLTWKIWLQLCGTVFLVWLGTKTFFAPPPMAKLKLEKRNNLFADYISMFLLTLVNPLTLIGFIAIFTTFGAHEYGSDFYNSFFMLLGFIFMSFSYCMILVTFTHSIKEKFINDRELLRMLNQLSGLVIIVFTLVSFAFALVKN